MKKRVFFPSAVLTLAFLANIATTWVYAQNPIDGIRRMTRKNIEADPNKEYVLEETSGPMMIIVSSFGGKTGREDANKLVQELRSRYKMKAYLYEKTFVHKLDPEQSRDLLNRPRNYLKKGEKTEYAVLVGDFQSTEDRDYQQTLKELKECRPTCMKPANFSDAQYAKTNPPLAKAFATRNPMQPPEMARGTVDDFVEMLNSVSEYSLLRNPCKYTVQVATFTGEVEINQSKIREIMEKEKNKSFAGFGNNKAESQLEKAGKAAVILCALLREKGYEAYEFHDRHSSIVTVGGFDIKGYELPDGTTTLHPDIANIIERFGGSNTNPQGPAARPGEIRTFTYEPKKVAGIELDMRPKVIDVPRSKKKATASAIYGPSR